jgi:Mg2+ and Co2+ transporter CorA
VRKYLMKFDVSDNTMAVLSSIENEVYRVEQKVKKQQLTLMDMWKK